MPENLTDWLGFIVPEETVNYVSNPSFERDTAGWTAWNATLGRRVGGWHGGYAGTILATSASGQAYTTMLASAALAAPYTVSAKVQADSPLVQVILSDGVSQVIILNHPGDGAFHTLTGTITPGAGTTLTVIVRDARTSGWTTVAFDGVQVEQKAYATSYCDGDQEDCAWAGPKHASVSRRPPSSSSGGRYRSFRDLGANVRSILGAGAPPMNQVSEPYAILPGSEYQKTVVNARVITLNCQVLSGSRTGLHALRQLLRSTMIRDGLKNAAVWLWYSHASGEIAQIQCHYDGGLELTEPTKFNETFAIRLVAHDPYWQADHDLAVAMNGQDLLPLGTTMGGLVIRKNDQGDDTPSAWGWANMGLAAGDNALITVIATAPNGYVYVAGTWTTLGGLSIPSGAAYWDGYKWNGLGGSISGGTINCFAFGDDGTVYIGGSFTTIGGVAATRFAAFNPSTGACSIIQNYTSGAVNALVVHPVTGYIFIGGSMARTNWTGLDVFCPLTPGSTDFDGTFGQTQSVTGIVISGSTATVYALEYHDGALYFGGDFTTITYTLQFLGTQAPVSVSRVGRWKFRVPPAVVGAPERLINQTGAYGLPGTVYDLLESADGRYVYAGGSFSLQSGKNSNCVAQWDGSMWAEMGDGFRSSIPDLGGSSVTKLGLDADGNLWATGNFTGVGTPYLGFTGVGQIPNVAVGGANINAGTILSWVQNLARWNGIEWTLGDAMFYGGQGGVAGQNQRIQTIEFNLNGELMMSAARTPTGLARPGTFTGITKPVTVDAPTPIHFIIPAIALTYLSQIINWSTGQRLVFRQQLYPLKTTYPRIQINTEKGEQHVMLNDVKDGSGYLSGDSGLATFWLQQGKNKLSLFTPTTGTTTISVTGPAAVMYFRERLLSIDAIPRVQV